MTKTSPEGLEKEFNNCIMSISGWRKLFAVDRKDDSESTEIGAFDKEILLAMFQTLAEYFSEKKNRRIVLARDSRPTGLAISAIAKSVLTAMQIELIELGISALPECLSFVRLSENLDGFIYISASHNPSGYNGIKAGNADASVFPAEIMTPLINRVKEVLFTEGQKSTHSIKESDLTSTDESTFIQNHKSQALELYRQALLKTLGDDKTREQIYQTLKSDPITVVLDFNGSARASSVDRVLLQDLGFQVKVMGDKMGTFPHRIVPEGESLIPARDKLAELAGNEAMSLAMVVDCDGDRGNWVFHFKLKDFACDVIPSAQHTFALSVLAILATAPEHSQNAVAVNGPTSLLCDHIAETMKAKVFRAEVGEANVLALAEKLRQKGYRVPILGEGSNGGNITPPGSVRDPMSSLLALTRVLFSKRKLSQQSLLDWILSKFEINVLEDSLAAKLYALFDYFSEFTTTSAYEEQALFQVKCREQAKLKSAYEKIFTFEFEKNRKQLMTDYNIHHYEIFQYEGTESFTGPGNRHGEEDGGFKVEFYSKEKKALGYMWMRASRTEPVFRVMVDWKGDRKTHDYFLSWHRNILTQADKNAKLS